MGPPNTPGDLERIARSFYDDLAVLCGALLLAATVFASAARLAADAAVLCRLAGGDTDRDAVRAAMPTHLASAAATCVTVTLVRAWLRAEQRRLDAAERAATRAWPAQCRDMAAQRRADAAARRRRDLDEARARVQRAHRDAQLLLRAERAGVRPRPSRTIRPE